MTKAHEAMMWKLIKKANEAGLNNKEVHTLGKNRRVGGVKINPENDYFLTFCDPVDIPEELIEIDENGNINKKSTLLRDSMGVY